MAGHSKFKNIMHRKGAQDKKRSAAFSKLSREITVAAKSGMPDPDMNPRLRQLERRLRVLVEEHFLHRRAIGSVRGDHREDGIVQMVQPFGHRRLRIGRHLPMRDMAQPRALTSHDPPAGARERGIETEDEGQASFSIAASETS